MTWGSGMLFEGGGLLSVLDYPLWWETCKGGNVGKILGVEMHLFFVFFC